MVARSLFLFIVLACFLPGDVLAADAPIARHPALPEANGKVEIEMRDGGNKPPRNVAVHLVYPGGKLSNVTKQTGLMLSLHNWGGMIFDNAPNPKTLAENYDLLVIGVTYYQSGDKETGPEPYDYSYLQTMDVLRALHYVYQSLKSADHPFDASRIYCTGGSGGGHVTQMANKFAPNTFACIIDLSGMSCLNDDCAFKLHGSRINGRYSKDPSSENYLSPAMQEIRDLGNPAHLALQSKSENHCKIVVIHGEDDPVCLSRDKHHVVEAMKAAGLDVEPHFITKADVDGKLVKNSAHQIGERTGLLMHFAGKYLSPKSEQVCRLTKPDDFDRKTSVVYPVTGGIHTIAYTADGPVLTFQATESRGK